jgi:hypothetical protein
MTNPTTTARHRYVYERSDGHRIQLDAVGDGDEVHISCGHACIGPDIKTALLRWADELRELGYPEMAEWRKGSPSRNGRF